MQEHWKDNKAIQVGVGITTIAAVLWFYFTGDIPLLADMVANPPEDEDGKVQAVPIWPILGGMLLQFCGFVGMWVIGMVIGLWSAVSGGIQLLSGKSSSQESAADASSKAVLAESPDVLMLNLARSVATKDISSEAKYKTQIRMPYAVQGMMTAIDEGDFPAADAFYAEIKELHGIGQTAAQTRAQSRAKDTAKGGDK